MAEKENKEIFKWHGWASPVGLSIFIISIGLTVLLFSLAVNVSVDAGFKGSRIKYRSLKEWRPPVEQDGRKLNK